jgi:hypothetical protein
MCKVSQKSEQNAPVITHQKSATIYLLFNYKACTTHYVKICKKFAVLGLGLPVCKMYVDYGEGHIWRFVFNLDSQRKLRTVKQQEQYVHILKSRWPQWFFVSKIFRSRFVDIGKKCVKCSGFWAHAFEVRKKCLNDLWKSYWEKLSSCKSFECFIHPFQGFLSKTFWGAFSDNHAGDLEIREKLSFSVT